MGIGMVVAVNTLHYHPPSRVALGKCLSDHLCKHAHTDRVIQRVSNT